MRPVIQCLLFHSFPYFMCLHRSGWAEKVGQGDNLFCLLSSQQAFLSLEDFTSNPVKKKSICPNCVVLGLFLMYNHIHDEQNIITADSAEIISYQHKTN